MKDETELVKQFAKILFQVYQAASPSEMDDYELYLHLVRKRFYQNADELQATLVRGYQAIRKKINSDK